VADRNVNAIALDVVIAGCKNLGYDLTCGACAEVFFTGGCMSEHDPGCSTVWGLRCQSPSIVEGPEWTR
jgi:hypothetical protein